MKIQKCSWNHVSGSVVVSNRVVPISSTFGVSFNVLAKPESAIKEKKYLWIKFYIHCWMSGSDFQTLSQRSTKSIQSDWEVFPLIKFNYGEAKSNYKDECSLGDFCHASSYVIIISREHFNQNLIKQKDENTPKKRKIIIRLRVLFPFLLE